MGDIETLKTVMCATAAELADPASEAPIRALNLEIADDPALAARYREKRARPVGEARKDRLPGATSP
ncbi:hypothetical protein [Micromonospora rhizosphaerae]|uniref:hypothetical protein n=1 Tax=Micromonospora rhizosphaerae TaxID=568872 RepID=UPI000B811D59|nr:hypothetical protein [Micromonospora rhizosphaerae]